MSHARSTITGDSSGSDCCNTYAGGCHCCNNSNYCAHCEVSVLLAISCSVAVRDNNNNIIIFLLAGIHFRY